MNLKKSFKDVAVLVTICAVFAVILAAVNSITAPIIADRLAGAADEAYLAVMPDATGFEDVDLSQYELPSTVVEAKKENSGMGYAIKLETKGYDKGMVIIVGVSAEGVVTGATCVTSNETNGDEKNYGENFTGKDIDSASSVDLIGGSTLTTTAYRGAVVDAINAATIIGGGSVDIRTPEQILQDNCNAALGTTDVVFTRWFATEVITGVDKIYVAADNSGYVLVFGESFVGVNEVGVTTPDVSAENAATATTAYATITASTLTEITEIPEGVNKKLVKKAYVTASGNYVFDLSAQGYDVMFEYSHGNMAGNPQPISIKVSIDSEGKIIDCVTVAHSESTGIGDKCATDEYREGWIGATDGDVAVSQNPGSVGVITGATYTSEGYQKAIKAAFAAFELITEGGAD